MWQSLPRRGGDSTESVMIAKYPEYTSDFDDVKSLQAYDLVLDITKGARSLLAQYNILKNGQVYVESSNKESYTIISEQLDSIAALIKGVESVKVVSVHVLVKGQIDLDSEITKVQKKLNTIKDLEKKALEAISKFTEKTNAEAREAAHKKVENYKAEIEGYEHTIEVLEKLKLWVETQLTVSSK